MSKSTLSLTLLCCLVGNWGYAGTNMLAVTNLTPMSVYIEDPQTISRLFVEQGRLERAAQMEAIRQRPAGYVESEQTKRFRALRREIIDLHFLKRNSPREAAAEIDARIEEVRAVLIRGAARTNYGLIHPTNDFLLVAGPNGQPRRLGGPDRGADSSNP